MLGFIWKLLNVGLHHIAILTYSSEEVYSNRFWEAFGRGYFETSSIIIIEITKSGVCVCVSSLHNNGSLAGITTRLNMPC